MPLPLLDPEERREALQQAAEARRARAEAKQMLKVGEMTLRQVLDLAQDAEALAKMKVSEVIEAMPNMGKVRSRRLMEKLNISPSRRVRGLGSKQRAALLQAFEEQPPS